VEYASNGRPQYIEFVKERWHHIADYDNKEFWLNTGDIEKHTEGKLEIRRVFAMVRISDGDKKVPGIGEGVRRIYNEGVINCEDGALIPVMDYYTDDLGVVVGVHRHPRGSLKSITRGAQATGTLAWAAWRVACFGEQPPTE
jgi:hypothetical protein